MTVHNSEKEGKGSIWLWEHWRIPGFRSSFSGQETHPLVWLGRSDSTMTERNWRHGIRPGPANEGEAARLVA